MNRESILEGIKRNKDKSIVHVFNHYRTWVKNKAPSVEKYLKRPDSSRESKFNTIEEMAQKKLPDDFKTLYSYVDGESKESTGFIFGVNFLSLDDIIKQLEIWCEIIDAETDPETLSQYDTSFKSYPAEAIKLIYSRKGWIPITYDFAGNHIGIDLDPGPNGKTGQIINFGRDEEIKCVIADDLKDFISILSYFADEDVCVFLGENQDFFTLTKVFFHDQLKVWLYPDSMPD